MNKIQRFSYRSKFVAALVGMLLMAVVASRQLFLFAVLRGPSGLNTAEGNSHWWVAAIAGATACIAAGLMSYFYNRHETYKWSKVAMTPTGPLYGSALNQSNSRPLALFDAKRWAFANAWLSERQLDDRMPMNGSVRNIGGTPSEQRAFNRRTLQSMFKKWSQARRD